MEYTKYIDSSKYQVTRDGDVLGPKGNKLKFKLTKTGYYEVSIRIAGEKRSFRVNRLVAKAFIENPENKPFVNHMNGNKLDNRVENLEWVTHKENMSHAKIHGLILRGDRNPRASLKEAQVEEICKLIEMGYRNNDIAKSVSTTPANVAAIRAGSCWEHISCKYVIPRRSRSLSNETIHWVCQQIKEGKTQGEILALSRNSRITKTIIKDIRRKRIYRDISKLYF